MAKRIAVPAIAAIFVLCSVMAFANGSQETAASGSTGATDVTVMSHFFGAAPPDPNGEIQKDIEKATNTNLKITWVSANNYTDKLNVTLASGDIPDLVMIGDPFGNTVFRSMVQQGAFWNIGPYINDYPNFTRDIAPVAWTLTKMNGGNYGIPRPRPSEGDSFFVIRKDWLDKLGMKVPANTDELYAMMQAFTNKDPDGNGKNDTFGFTGYINPTDMGSFGQFESVFTGANGMWKLSNGKLEFTAFLPEEKQALEYLNRAFKEGLIPPDFASIKLSQSKDLYESGKAGMIVDKTGTMTNYTDVMKQNNPNVDYNSFYPLTSVNGYNPKGPGFAGVLAIPRTVPQAKMKKILAMVNRWMDQDVFDYQHWGVEGRDYTVKDGQKVLDSKQYQDDGLGEFNQIVYVSDPYASTSKDYFPQAAQTFYKKVQDDRVKTSVADESIGLYSATAQTYLPDIQKGLVDIKTKIILGVEPISAWDSFVAKLANDANMQKIINEMNAAYKDRNSGT